LQAAFYTGNLKPKKMPIYGPNLDPPFNIVREPRVDPLVDSSVDPLVNSLVAARTGARRPAGVAR
jgi:hypothetical protein